jgi:DNA uptake protein ComE-like DNA-binding protein
MQTIYKDGLLKNVYSVDLKAWLEDGWSLTPSSELIVNSDKINLNTANLNEIKSLPSVGIAIAKKIIDGRPYQSINDLPEDVDKNAIKDLISF